MNMTAGENVDPEEIEKFNDLAHRWWDTDGDFKPLHDINPCRLSYIQEKADLAAGPTLDVGCGGGILAESIARLGFETTGIDMAEKALGVAKLHALESDVNVRYEASTAENFALGHAEQFTTVTCLEMLEHVTDYGETIKACAQLARPGADLFFSTINRDPRAYVLLILGAEYVLNMLPRGTHEYSKFIKPFGTCRWYSRGRFRIAGNSWHELQPSNAKGGAEQQHDGQLHCACEKACHPLTPSTHTC
jgi:2-polyprenyl-6-hydroxyphenyl methylase/3-demethylubiquinone-9 3-methyltransferase